MDQFATGTVTAQSMHPQHHDQFGNTDGLTLRNQDQRRGEIQVTDNERRLGLAVFI